MYGTGVVTTLILISTWLTVAMAVLRYIAICHPFRSRTHHSRNSAYSSYLTVCVFCLVLNLPSFWQYKVLSLNLNNSTVYLVDIGYFDQDMLRGQIFIWIKFILGVVVPVVIMVVCNFSLIHALRKSFQMRRSSHVTQDGHRGRTITVTLITIIVMFLLFVFPSELLDFLSEHLQDNKEKHKELFLMFRCVTNLLQVSNFSFNVVLYCVINVHFRKTLVSMTTGRCNRHEYRRTNSTLSTHTHMVTLDRVKHSV